MKYHDLLTKIRYWDNLTAKWFIRHFYFMFFQIILVAIFVLWFINLFGVIDAVLTPNEQTNLEKILTTQSINQTIIVFLMLLNSFWFLFVFNNIQRMRTLLRDISYHLSRLRFNKNPRQHHKT